MALNPHVTRKAQAEIDPVVGNDRLPTLEDRQYLPYIDALTKEVFRWNVVAPLGNMTSGPAVFDITKFVENGVVIKPVHKNTDGLLTAVFSEFRVDLDSHLTEPDSHPEPYKCSIPFPKSCLPDRS